MLTRIAVATAFITPFFLGSGSPAKAQDAEFGCKVLLCAAATAPTWGGIPYCVPVMKQLFKNLARGKAWPICSAAKTGRPSYQPYESCPIGSVPATRSKRTREITHTYSETYYRYKADDQGGFCVLKDDLEKTGYCDVENSKTAKCGFDSDPNVTVRPSNFTNPYVIDLEAGGKSFRFRFNLEK